MPKRDHLADVLRTTPLHKSLPDAPMTERVPWWTERVDRLSASKRELSRHRRPLGTSNLKTETCLNEVHRGLQSKQLGSQTSNGAAVKPMLPPKSVSDASAGLEISGDSNLSKEALDGSPSPSPCTQTHQGSKWPWLLARPLDLVPPLANGHAHGHERTHMRLQARGHTHTQVRKRTRTHIGIQAHKARRHSGHAERAGHAGRGMRRHTDVQAHRHPGKYSGTMSRHTRTQICAQNL